jgi:hypothetical protein
MKIDPTYINLTQKIPVALSGDNSLTNMDHAHREMEKFKNINVLLTLEDLFLAYTKIPNKRLSVPVNAAEIKYRIFMDTNSQ